MDDDASARSGGLAERYASRKSDTEPSTSFGMGSELYRSLEASSRSALTV
jgi:hypothetical protein